MVVQRTINNLKDRPKDERKAVAGGIAIAVIAVLLLAWAILFFKRIQSGTQQVNLDFGAQNEFNFSGVRAAQEEIAEQNASGYIEDLSTLRDDAAGKQLQGSEQSQVQQQAGGTDAFGNPTSSY